jgi:anaerobic magnesium-protoporphyrin IX monomethyl ester cyclase
MHIVLISFLENSINIRVLSSYLKENGFDTTCFFCPDEFNETNTSILLQKIKDTGAKLIGMSLVTDDFSKSVYLTEKIKTELNLPVIWGGAHVNVEPAESLNYADVICTGEGEEALLSLVKSLQKDKQMNTSISNLGFKINDEIKINPIGNLEKDLNKYPIPDFDVNTQFVMHDKGFENLSDKHLKNEYSIITSRGCPYNCHYCYNSYRKKQYKGKGRYLRMRSIENVLLELKQAKSLFKGLKSINFWDDSFVARSLEEFEKFSVLYKKDINLPFFALIEPMVFKHDKIELLRAAGLISLQVGIQSGSDRVNRDVYNRKVKNERILKVAHEIDKLGIKVIYDVIFNNPYENIEDLQETIELFLKFPKNFNLQGYNLIFYPKTVITDMAIKDGYILTKDNSKDFSTIQDRTDSPIAMQGKSEVSSRFYKINYNSDHKVYYNSVLSLFGFNHVPRFVIMMFKGNRTLTKAVGLRMFYFFYSVLGAIKRFLIPPKTK